MLTVSRHVKEISENTDIDMEKVRNSKHLYEFDRYVQCPTWGYPTEGAYYRDASSSDSVMNIRVPFLAIHAVDDPIVNDAAVPYEEVKKNPYAVMCTTSLGGHLSFFELGGGRWYTTAVRTIP
jgi:predicted alpha/beta-fold hydrolase